ncbi:MAG: cytochrome c family protein [Hyphomicrobiaceae bacterium]|nr:cytochrome c family protein [Hyphomicrobiaceae bacterium]
MRIIGLAIAATVLSAGVAHAQDAAAGKGVFRKCQTCHKVGPAGLKQRSVGPHLNGLFGRKSGTVEGYKYSKANKESGVTWTEEVFTKYIKNPRAFMKGTRMSFGGIKDEKDIKDLIAYLKTFKADGTAAK